MNKEIAIQVGQQVATDISNILQGTFPVILGIMSALIGLGVAVYYIQRWIGHRDVDMHNRAQLNRISNGLNNWKYAQQLRNEELLGYGDKVQRIDSWLPGDEEVSSKRDLY